MFRYHAGLSDGRFQGGPGIVIFAAGPVFSHVAIVASRADGPCSCCRLPDLLAGASRLPIRALGTQRLKQAITFGLR